MVEKNVYLLIHRQMDLLILDCSVSRCMPSRMIWNLDGYKILFTVWSIVLVVKGYMCYMNQHKGWNYW